MKKKLNTIQNKSTNYSTPEIKLTLSDYVISECVRKHVKGMKALVFDIKK